MAILIDSKTTPSVATVHNYKKRFRDLSECPFWNKDIQKFVLNFSCKKCRFISKTLFVHPLHLVLEEERLYVFLNLFQFQHQFYSKLSAFEQFLDYKFENVYHCIKCLREQFKLKKNQHLTNFKERNVQQNLVDTYFGCSLLRVQFLILTIFPRLI